MALTGATGFIGSVLLKYLTEQGYLIRALHRPCSSPPKPIVSVTWVTGTLEDVDSLRALVTDVDVVVHCAGAVRGATLEQFKKINTEGVERLLQVAVEQRVSHFLLMSSLAAREPTLSAYALSKKLGEDILPRYNDKISWHILRPPAVYGPGDREMQPLLKLIKRGIIPMVGRKEGRFSLLYVDDLAEAVVCLLRSYRKNQGQCFELHDGHPDGYTWAQIAAIATHLNGKVPRCFSIPRGLLYIAGQINIAMAHLGHYQPMLTPGKVREIFHPDWVSNNTKITQALDWQPKILLQDGMKRLFY
ncbi:MAG: NAD-dependent epimerase/dehydratase family protein [Desulfuromusa sp.]|nr:NAD-dependent epimerase/dehydratase family protein [Desulfuromusa sp.]